MNLKPNSFFEAAKQLLQRAPLQNSCHVAEARDIRLSIAQLWELCTWNILAYAIVMLCIRRDFGRLMMKRGWWLMLILVAWREAHQKKFCRIAIVRFDASQTQFADSWTLNSLVLGVITFTSYQKFESLKRNLDVYSMWVSDFRNSRKSLTYIIQMKMEFHSKPLESSEYFLVFEFCFYFQHPRASVCVVVEPPRGISLHPIREIREWAHHRALRRQHR